MEEIKAPKKERNFLKAVGNIAKVLANELVMGIARKFIGKAIDKVGNKRQGLSIVLIILASSFAIAQYPTTGNKQRLGFQTTGDGLTWRGSISDTASIQPINNQNAWVILDTINLKFYTFDFTSNAWNLVGGASGLTMPFDSITFNTAKDGTVGVGEVEYNDTQGSIIQGLKGGNVTNVIGQQLHQRVNNRTGATLTKGTAVYLSGSQGNRITVAKALGVTDAFSANTFGIVAEDILNNQSGYVITEGLITGLNTSTLTEDSAVYLSPTVAGGLTSTKPQAPQHTVYIGVCVKSNAGSGELFVKIRNGQELDELHDVRITLPIDKASLYYSGGLWRDTTAALLVSDTAAMLANYATKAYADTTGRLYARQDFTNVSTSTLTWTQSDTLIPGGVTFVQVYRNGQILLPSQYTIPTSTSVIMAASSFKVNDNYTVIFPRGGGAGSGGGSGSLTSISAGTGITVSPNPITTTGVVSADLSLLMELTDTSLLNLTTRFASKLNTTDTASLSNRINAKGNGTVTSVATGYGLTGGTITTTGTLLLDSSVVFSRIRDSIVDVAIGNDTIKILKQEYAPATTSVLTWTITPKFPIQLKAYILVFRNGQLLINDQYNLTDTNKITIVSNSFKVGSNYTVVTVSGIGSVGTGVFPNPVYPDAGIALSTGTTWASSIPNNSTNWNTAFTDRLKWDGGATGLTPSTGRTSLGGTTIGQSMFTLTNPSSITFPRFNADNTVTALTSTNFRAAIGAGTVTEVDASATAGNPISITDKTTTPKIELLSATSGRNGYLTSTDWTTFNGKQAALSGLGFIKANGTTITYDNSTYLTTSSANTTYLAKTDTAAMLLPYFRDADTTTLNLTSRFASKLNISDTAAMLSNYNTRINSKLNISDTLSMLAPYFRDADTSLLNLTSRFNTKLNISDTSSMLSKYLRRADTSLLNLTSRFATKLNISDTAAMLSNYNSRINLKLNISDTLNMLVPYLRKADTTLMLSKYLRRADTSLLNLTSRFATKVNISDTAAMLSNYNSRINTKLNISDTAAMLIPYYKDADTSLLNLNSRFATKLNISDTSSMLSKYLRRADTSLLNLTSRFATKLNISDTAAMLSNYNSRINLKLNILDTTNMLVPYLRKVDTTNMLIPYLRDADTTNMLLPYFKDTDTTLLNLTSRFAAKQNNITLTTTGTSGASSFDGTTLNIPQYSSGSSGTVTSVGLTAPSIFNVGGSPVTTNGTLALTYSGTALPLLNGGTGATTADAALTNFGATVMGKSLFGLTNSVSDKFIKVNSNNTITLLNAADTRDAIGAGNITGNGVSQYFAIFGSSSYISQALLRWDGNTVPNSKLISDFNFNDFNGTLSVTGATTLSNLAGTGTRMVVASSTGLLSTQSIGTSVTSFSGGTTGLTPSTATTGEVTLGGTLAIGSGGTGATTSGGAITNLGATLRGSGTFTLPDISQVSFVRYNANNTVSQRTAEGIRIDLGGTTIGQNMFMLTNPSAITFPRFNADNTVSALSAADFRTAIGVSANANASLFISRTGTSVSFVEDLTSYSVIYLKLNNSSTITVTLPTASLNTNKSITIKNVGTGAVNSNASNVEPLNTTTLSSVLLVSGGGKFTTVVSDGTNWIKMAGN